MILQIDAFLAAEECQAIIDTLADTDFNSGQATAGGAARQVKHNEQITAPEHPALQLIQQRLQQHALFQQAVLPKQCARLMLNRYRAGMEYGLHVDDAVMNNVRTDISFTLLLSPSDGYQGGELELHDASGVRSWRLEQGQLLVYPSHYLHQVTQVTAGARVACVGWWQSRVRQAEQRQILFDLGQTAQQLLQQGNTQAYQTLALSHANLLRMWSEV